jgi:ATP-dependent DNA helicase RecG
VLKEILGDLGKATPMCRLLQGEVGSGKTVVATAALLMAVANDCQGAFMAPTEILAEQHFGTICQLLSRLGQEEGEGNIKSYTGFLDRPLKIALLIGDIKQAGKKKVQQQVQKGDIDIVIGTHALVQKGLEFSKLGLAVVDEQHRFGVEQRGALREKGFNPHMLVMTATPIPRTLALTLYGDLDLSVINELPPGRQTVRTKWLRPDQRESAYAFVRKQVGEGRQAFILCPLIEESDAIAAQAAVVEYERLSQEVFPDLRVGLLHGRLSSADKDAVMDDFRAGRLDILVSTPVIEVGIDIPNATVMLIESADRFGLSQLHQFRGRVGRGKEQSYCMLLAENPSEVGRERLDIIENTQDGFKLAEEDLKMRGPGEFFGTRQSGLPDLRMARISDVALLELARNEAVKLFRFDPGMERAEHKPLVQELARVWKDAGEWS